MGRTIGDKFHDDKGKAILYSNSIITKFYKFFEVDSDAWIVGIGVILA